MTDHPPIDPPSHTLAIRTMQLCKHYVMGESTVHALDGVDLTMRQGEFVSIIGASGSGKSTLMHILGCLLRPTSGNYEFAGQPVQAMSDKQLAQLRNRRIGFVFQTFNLIQRTSALENVMVPLIYTRTSYSKSSAKHALDRVGLAHRSKHKPNELSGGECQRVAIARAIVNSPSLILADEPTGNLDTKTGQQIMDIFHELHSGGITVVIVTHEMDVAVQANRIIQMRDGKVLDDSTVDHDRREEILKQAQSTHTRIIRRKSPMQGERAAV
jgi:putative ABC transport system ATP-binding protein